MSDNSDVIIIGAGHNGLVCAYYLASAGLSVSVLERRGVVGGAAVTEEFHPGFRNSVASYTVSLLNPTVIRDLELHRHGLQIVERQVSNFLPFNDREYLLGTSAQEIAKFSAKDAGRIDAYHSRLEAIADVVRDLILQTPPNVTADGWLAALPELLGAASVGKRLARLDMTARRDLLALFSQSGGDWLDGWFESDPIKAVLGFDSIVGNYASPYTPGSAYVLLHHVFGEVNGKKGVWGHAIGGMGAITQAMASACREIGVDIRTDKAVKKVVVEKGRAAGVVLADGSVMKARRIVSNLTPRLLFEDLLEPQLLPEDFRDRIARYRYGSGTFRMNVALSDLPRFSSLPGAGPHLTAGIIMAPSLAYMDRAFNDAKEHGWSRAPIVEMLVPSVVDDSLAPPGRHVASLFCQHVAPELPNGESWDAMRDEVAELMLNTVETFAPGFRQSVIGMTAMSPLDLERTFGLTGGDIMHGRLSLDQLFSARPVLGHGDYRSPIDGLYMCGSGTHPGGGVTGAPGHNAAMEILKDARRKAHPKRAQAGYS